MRELRFSDFRIDLESMSLYRGEDQIPIGRKTLDTLLFLIGNKNQIVSHETLRRNVWKSAHISTSTIPMCILEIRKVLNEEVSSPRYIASKKGRGYRFIADVTFHADPDSGGASRSELPFTGRKSAINTLLSASRATVTNLQGTLVTVVGEAGSGKSRLISEFIHLSSHQLDHIVAKTTSQDEEFAFSIWTQALRAALVKFPANKKLAEYSDQISTYVPELRVDPNGITRSQKIDRSGFFSHWLNAFRSIPDNRPLLFVLEDLHQADNDSIQLLEYIAGELTSFPILVIATARPSLATRQNLSALSHILGSPDPTSVRLLPFTIDEIESLIPDFHPNRRKIALDTLSRTAGNPFYVTHLLRLDRYLSGEICSNPSTPLLTENASEIVERQLSDLPYLTRQSLQVAAVIGTRFNVSLIANALGASPAETLERLEPARAARLIHADESDSLFCHSLLRDLLYQSIGKRDRADLHSKIATFLESRIDGDKHFAPAIFHHLCEAFPLVSIDRVRKAGLSAAAGSMLRFAYNEAARILRTALDISSRSQAFNSTAHLDLMIALANSTLYLGDRQGAKWILTEAASLARKLNSPEHLAQCGLAMAPDFLSIEVGAYDLEILMILKESLERLPTDSLALRARVLARISQMSIWSGSIDFEIEAMTKSALEAARSSGDSRALIAALAARADASHGPDRVDERIKRTLELQEATLLQSDTYAFLVQQTRLIAALLEKGEIRRISIENDRYRRIAEQTGLPQYKWYPVSTDSMLACLRGDIELADRFAHQYRELAGSSPDQNFMQTFACQHALREIERGESAAVLPLAQEFARRHTSVFSWAAATAWIQWDCGQHDAARETLNQFSESDIRKLFREPGGTIGVAALAEATAYLGEKSRVRFLFDLIMPVANTFATAGYGVAYFGCMARYASVLATALRRKDEAFRLASAAVEQESRLNSRSWTIYAKLDRIRAERGRLNLSGLRLGSEFGSLAKASLSELPRANRCIREVYLFDR